MRRSSTRTWGLVFVALHFAPEAGAQNNQRWSAFVSTRGGLFHNRLNALPVAATDGLGNVTAALAYSRYTRSSLFTLSGWASGLYVSGLSLGTFSVSASGRKQATPKFQLRYGAGLSDGFNFQDLVVNGILFIDQGVLSAFATGGTSYDFTDKTTGFADFTYVRFRFDLQQEIDASDFVFVVPGDDEILIPLIPEGQPFPTNTTENVLDASRLAAGLLAAEGTLRSEFTTDSSLVSGGVSHRFTNRTDVDFRAGYRQLRYRSPFTTSGSDSYASASLNHTFDTRTDFQTVYTYRRNHVFEPALFSHTLLGRVDRELSVPLRLEGSFGFTYYPLPTVDSSGYQLVGGASLSGQYVRTSFRVAYDRRSQHSIGIGRFLTTDLANAGVSYALARDWSATAFAGVRWSRGTFDEGFAFTTVVAGANVSHRISKEFSVGGSYLYRHLERSSFDFDIHLLSAVLTFGKTWK